MITAALFSDFFKTAEAAAINSCRSKSASEANNNKELAIGSLDYATSDFGFANRFTTVYWRTPYHPRLSCWQADAGTCHGVHVPNHAQTLQCLNRLYAPRRGATNGHSHPCDSGLSLYYHFSFLFGLTFNSLVAFTAVSILQDGFHS